MKLKGEAAGDLSGFLDSDTDLTGELNFKDTLRIDGKFQGSVRTGKSLVIGETADVNAEIDVDAIFISGKVQGKVRARERVELHRTARVDAELHTKILVVEEGAQFEGHCSMKSTTTKKPLEQPATAQTEKKQIFEVKRGRDAKSDEETQEAH